MSNMLKAISNPLFGSETHNEMGEETDRQTDTAARHYFTACGCDSRYNC